MPDVHAGKGCTVGTTMKIVDRACPNLVGVDIGCGVEVYKFKTDKIDFAKLDEMLQANTKVPYGFSKRNTAHRFANNARLKELRCFDVIDYKVLCYL